MANEEAKIVLYILLGVIMCIAASIFTRWAILKKRCCQYINIHDNNLFKLITILTFMSFILYSAAAGGSYYNYSTDIESTCIVVGYDEINDDDQYLKIRVKVDIIKYSELKGRESWKCVYSYYDLPKYKDCINELKLERPLGFMDKCWYNKNNYNYNNIDDSYLIYWNQRVVKNFWVIFIILGSLLAVELFIMFMVPKILILINKYYPVNSYNYLPFYNL